MKLLPLLLLLLLPAVAQAQFTFTTNNGAITITGYTGSNNTVTIPSTIGGLPVASIGDWAFASASITTVLIPNSVIRIGDYAFVYCAKLTSVTIPNSVNSIGVNAFLYSHLTSVTIPNSVTNIGEYAFQGCASLTAFTVDIGNQFFASTSGVLFNRNQTLLVQYPAGRAGGYNIPNTVTRIGDNAFGNCYYLTDVTIPNSVTNLGYGAFYYCTSLANVVIPSSVISIGVNAFNYCTSLTSVTIPSSVTYIGNYVFIYCYSLTNIAVDASNSFYSSIAGVLFNRHQTALLTFPAGKAGGYTIPNTVTNIEDGAFFTCLSLTNVSIPNSVIRIGDDAFFVCINLVSTIIPNSVTSIGAEAFFRCFNQASITIPDSVTNIGLYAFYNCQSLTNVTMGSSVANIGDLAFADCSSLVSISFRGNIPSSVGGDVFNGSSGTVYYLPNKTGWGMTFFGRPTALWLAKPQSVGTKTNQFSFTINWASGQTVVVEASTNLVNWQLVQTNTLTTGSAYFSDPQWTNFPGRFYRLRSP